MLKINKGNNKSINQYILFKVQDCHAAWSQTNQTNGGCLKINNHKEKNETTILKNIDCQK